MLPALPVNKISAREPGMASAGRDPIPSTDTTPSPQRAASANGSADGDGAVAELFPVRAGEDRWSEAELTEVRSQLAAEIAEFRSEIAAAESQIAEGDDTSGAGDDQADAGAKTYEREHEMAIADNARELLEQNERAVQRMDAGTYGICESCGKPIGKARLQAFPRATLCVTCKQRQERR